ncbi:hypothetical protein HY745_09745 [Candidatus Desantisbacteria bacterium]|nr:hypothetical protein [Candidatus Desantisbacteria bacterium]
MFKKSISLNFILLSFSLLILLILVVPEIKQTEAAVEISAIKLLIPRSNIVVMRKSVSIIGTVSDEGLKGISILINNEPRKLAKVKNGMFYANLSLDPGLNKITIKGEEKDVGISTLDVFYKDAGTKIPPDINKMFTVFYTHDTVEKESECDQCHDFAERTFNKMKKGEISCTSEQCHKSISSKAYEVVHGPVATDACNACHTPHGSVNKFELVTTGSPLCYRCHTDKEAAFAQSYIHGPVGGGDCIACHDPHGSKFKFSLRKWGAELCYMCHQGNKAEGKYVHGPVAANDCNVCHNPHGSPNRYQLEEAGADLCYMCHQEKKAAFQKEFVHQPVAKGECSRCHTAHSSDNKSQLLKPNGFELCNELCHVGEGKKGKNVKVPHPPVAQGKCTECHDAHGTDIKYHLFRAGAELCYECHQSMKTRVLAKYPHGPVIQGDCVACHNAHGSDFTKILIKEFPKDFYTPFEVIKYEICFNCHQKTVVLDEFTTTLTDFRNGSQNLHYAHVNRKKGRSCRACHEMHSSDQEKHIRKEIPFSEFWSYSILFTKTPTGGKCVVGCHKPRAYDRENAIDRKEW